MEYNNKNNKNDSQKKCIYVHMGLRHFICWQREKQCVVIMILRRQEVGNFVGAKGCPQVYRYSHSDDQQ